MKSIIDFDILLRPVVTEKAKFYERLSKYTFIVSRYADKKRIKRSVEMIYKYKVSHINIVNVSPKKKIFRGKKGFESSLKKAIVTFEKKIKN